MNDDLSVQPDLSVPEIVTTRVFAVSPARLFQQFSDAKQLATWWGPNGFTNTIERFEFRPGGAWHITMRAPDGAEYPNESRFLAIVPEASIAFVHLGPMHRYWMTMIYAPEKAGTRLTWRMRFADHVEYEKVHSFVTGANEQNFDRLGASLADATH